MIPIARLKARFPRVAGLVEPHFDFLRKAMTFAVIGLVNLAVDSGVFFLILYLVGDLAPPAAGAEASFKLAVATTNALSWAVAVSGSYVMNSFITFAAESGRKLRWRTFATFAMSGLLGLGASEVAVLAALEIMPVIPAKGCAVLAAFVVNFSMSHFVVFRRHAPRPSKP